MCSGFPTAGLPSTSPKKAFISGIWRIALIIAKAMMCVNETFPPRPRARWLLITIRLSIINFAGTARTEVAVGTVSDASIDCTTRPATPRSGSIVAALGEASVGAGFTSACAGVAGTAATSRTTGCV